MDAAGAPPAAAASAAAFSASITVTSSSTSLSAQILSGSFIYENIDVITSPSRWAESTESWRATRASMVRVRVVFL